jgi:hypothetical protein
MKLASNGPGCGEGRIRTSEILADLQVSVSRDQCNQPLCHLSNSIESLL